MKDFLEEIEILVMPHIEIEVMGVLLMGIVLIYILFRYQSRVFIILFKERLSLIDEKGSTAELVSEQCSKSITLQEQFFPMNTRDREITNIPGPILITDDDKNMCEVLADILEEQFKGFSIEIANDGEDALQHINQHLPSLLILDLKMPRKTGFEVLKELSTRNEMFPILVISSDPSSKENILQHVDIAVNRFEYLNKRFSVKEFVEVIQKMLSQQIR